MKRRQFLTTAGAGVAASTLAAPAIAQSAPEIRWRLASSFPKSLDTLFGTAEHIARRVGEATDGKFQIRAFAAGEIVPGLQVLDAVQNNTVECGHTPPYYYIGKDTAFAFGTALPFGLNARQHNAWMYHGGGLDLMRGLMNDYNIVNFPAGNTGTQMGGWFRKDIKTAKDLEGLKFRIAGVAGQIFAKLGAVPTATAPADIYPALEKGTIEAVEFVGPYDDEKLGFVKIAKNYYYPGFWEGGAGLDLLINAQQWQNLPKPYQAAMESACAEANMWCTAKYDVVNGQALRRLIAAGAVLRPFPREIMEAAHKVAFELYDEMAAKNANFKKIYDPWKAFRDETYTWFRIADYSFDNFVQGAAARERQQQRPQQRGG
jgi:TRAP-type mannitol/chloroaromatic compound transport system substrate-binding protein